MLQKSLFESMAYCSPPQAYLHPLCIACVYFVSGRQPRPARPANLHHPLLYHVGFNVQSNSETAAVILLWDGAVLRVRLPLCCCCGACTGAVLLLRCRGGMVAALREAFCEGLSGIC